MHTNNRLEIINILCLYKTAFHFYYVNCCISIVEGDRCRRFLVSI